MGDVIQFPRPAAPAANHTAVVCDVPTALYRVFNGDELAYVGITSNPRHRMRAHRATKPWWGNHLHITTEWHRDRQSAEVAERLAIREERPLHNIIRYGESMARLEIPERWRKPSWDECHSLGVPYIKVTREGRWLGVHASLDPIRRRGDPNGPLGWRWEHIDVDQILPVVRSTIVTDALHAGCCSSINSAHQGTDAFITHCLPADALWLADICEGLWEERGAT